MKKKYNILIAEPSVIIQEGLSCIIEAVNIDLCISKVDSFNNCLKLDCEEPFHIVLINPVLLNNFPNALIKIYSHFNDVVLLGIISTIYDRTFCCHFHDCIYINDNKELIKNTITKHLTLKNDTMSLSGNILSERETDVLKLLVIGKLNKEIAEELFISIHTVVTHRKNISNKLGIKSTAAMAIYAVAKNIIDLNDSLKTII